MRNKIWMHGIVGGCALAVCLAMASTTGAADKSWNKTGTGDRTDNLHDSANWTGGSPGTADDAYMVWTRSTSGPGTKVITNKSTDVLDIRSLTITNQSSKDTVFIYIKGATFLTNGPGALLFAGSTASPITLAFSNNVTFNTASFVGQNGNATLTFASGATVGSNLTFTSGSGQNYLLVTGAGGLTLSSNLVVAVNHTNNAVIMGANSSVAGRLLVSGSQAAGLIVTNSTLTVSNGVSNTGGIKVANLGILNITGTWTNNGTLDIAAAGALTGGTLTNQSNGTMTGSGFVKTLVVNQGRVNFGGTVSNDFVQSTGSFTLSGNATITGSSAINGGALNLLGNRFTSGALFISSGGTISNTTTGATIASPVVNAGTVYFANDVYALGSVTNTGSWTHRGVISNNVVNAGTMTILKNSINPRITGGVVNSGSLTMDANASATINGAVSNSSHIAFAGQILGDYVQTGGTLTVASTGVANLNSIGGTASILGGVFDLNGRTYSNGAMTVAGSGLLTNNIANGSFSGPLSNAATVNVAADTCFNGPVVNTGEFTLRGVVSNSFANAGTLTVNGTATVTGPLTSSGRIKVSSLGTLSSGQTWQNTGLLNMQGGAVGGAPLVNTGTMSGFGTVAADLHNTGTLHATGAGMTFSGLVTNSGSLNAINSFGYFGQNLANAGVLSLQGGTVTGNVINTASGTVEGNGFVVGDLTNDGTINPGFSAGTLTVTGNVNLASSGLLLMELIATNNVNALDGVNDKLVVAGQGNVLTFGGTLTVLNMTGGEFSISNSFQLFILIGGATQSGDFAVTNLPGLNTGLAWDTSRLKTEGIISVIPEPSALLLAAIGMLVAVFGIRRRRAKQIFPAMHGKRMNNHA